jgi:hypothetical protein
MDSDLSELDADLPDGRGGEDGDALIHHVVDSSPSIAVRSCWDEGTMLAFVGREHCRLSVTDGCQWKGGDGTSMLFRIAESLVNIAHFQKKLRNWELRPGTFIG